MAVNLLSEVRPQYIVKADNIISSDYEVFPFRLSHTPSEQKPTRSVRNSMRLPELLSTLPENVTGAKAHRERLYAAMRTISEIRSRCRTVAEARRVYKVYEEIEDAWCRLDRHIDALELNKASL